MVPKGRIVCYLYPWALRVALSLRLWEELMQKAIIELRGVSKRFGRSEAVRDVSFTIFKGSICALIGENGAGKSTLIKLINGLSRPSDGNIVLFGRSGASAIQRIRSKIGYMPDSNSSYRDLSARDNLVARCMEWGIPIDGSIDDVLAVVGLGDTGKIRVRGFSMGMKRRLDLAIALLGNPELLILDEPTNGLDPMGVSEVRRILTRLNEERGATVLVSSHNLGELHKIATDYLFIKQGELLRSMSALELERECEEELVLRVDNPARAIAILGQSVLASRMMDGTALIRIAKTGSGSGAVVKLLSDAGVNVLDAYSERRSLEQFYLSLIGSEA